VSASSEQLDGGAGDRTQCTPCRGTGKLVSNLGGEPHQVTCPWCTGSGEFRPGLDAQEGESAEASA
jgi:DnaJ-class molecular chaperone